MRHLREYRERVEAAGGADAYYNSGGCLGPWGKKGEAWVELKKGTKAPVKRAAKPSTSRRSTAPTTLEEHGQRVRDLEVALEAARYALVMAAKQAVADGVNMAEIGRRVGLSRARIHQLLAGRH